MEMCLCWGWYHSRRNGFSRIFHKSYCHLKMSESSYFDSNIIQSWLIFYASFFT